MDLNAYPLNYVPLLLIFQKFADKLIIYFPNTLLKRRGAERVGFFPEDFLKYPRGDFRQNPIEYISFRRFHFMNPFKNFFS